MTNTTPTPPKIFLKNNTISQLSQITKKYIQMKKIYETHFWEQNNTFSKGNSERTATAVSLYLLLLQNKKLL